MVNNTKNRERDRYSFANINLLGPCNSDCFFCLGKDLPELQKHNHLAVHFLEWPNFTHFLERAAQHDVRRLYVTGLTTDSLCYQFLGELIKYLQGSGFQVGMRTNGFLALKKMDVINACIEEVGYTVHSLNPVVHKMIAGNAKIPDWQKILTRTTAPMRVQLVVNRCNKDEFWHTLRYVCNFPKVRYVQIRRISTDTRAELLAPDMAAFEQIYTQASKMFPLKHRLWHDADVYRIYGKDVCFWRTIKTSVNSLNYFTDGTVSEEYFIIEGYSKNRKE